MKALRPGLKVRTRAGFSDLSRETETTMLVESAQLFDLPLPGGDLGVTFGEPSGDGRKMVILPMVLKIPLDRIILVPDGDEYTAQLELRVAATDDSGGDAPITVMPLEVRGNAPSAPGAVAAIPTEAAQEVPSAVDLGL